MKSEDMPESLFMLHPNQTAQWHALINEAQADANIRLPVDLESYLVFLLIRFTNKASLGGSVLGLEYLEQVTSLFGSSNSMGLQVVGDKCLLFAGLFPDHAKRRRLTPNYFVQLGQTAYNTIAFQENGSQSLFYTLSEGFIEMMDVLQASRGPKVTLLSPNLSQSLSSDSLYAYQPTNDQLKKPFH